MTDLARAYVSARTASPTSWALAWYLAAEIGTRYGGSQGLLPRVICHEGLGYYGIELRWAPCKVRAAHGLAAESLGRFSMAGDVQNWTAEDSLSLSTLEAEGVSTAELLKRAISILRLESRPDLPHVRCRHVRWADQHRLLLQVAAILAFRHGPERLEIWNDVGVTFDREPDEAFGYMHHWTFLRRDTEARVLIAPDGGVVIPEAGRSLWERHLAGESAEQLAAWIESALQSSSRVESTWRLARGDLADVAADVLIVPTSGRFGGEGAAQQVAARLRARHPAVQDLRERVPATGVAAGTALLLERPAGVSGYPHVVCASIGAAGDRIPEALSSAFDAIEPLRQAAERGGRSLRVALPSLESGGAGRASAASASAIRATLTDLLSTRGGLDVTVMLYGPEAHRCFRAAFESAGHPSERAVRRAPAGRTTFDPDALAVEVLNDRRAILLVGSGLSFNALPPKPDWRSLICGDAPAPSPADVPLEELAQARVDEEGHAPLEERMVRLLGTRSAPSVAHYQLLDFPWSAVFTTNYDTLIEDTLEGLRIPHRVITHDDEITTLVEGEHVPVIKLHGGFCHRRDGGCTHRDHERAGALKHDPSAHDLVTTTDQFDAFFEQRPAMAAFLEDKLLTRRGLVVGYRLSDPHIRQLVRRIGRTLVQQSDRPRLVWLSADPISTGPSWLRRGVLPVHVPLSRAGAPWRNWADYVDHVTHQANLERARDLLPADLFRDASWSRLLDPLTERQLYTLLRVLSDAGVTPPLEEVRERLDFDGSESDLVDQLALLHHSPDQRAALRAGLPRRHRR